jgi:HlyD family secretion protein
VGLELAVGDVTASRPSYQEREMTEPSSVRGAVKPAPNTVATVVPLRETSLPALIAAEHRRRRRRTFVWLGLGLGVAIAIAGVVLATRPRPIPLEARFRTAGVTRGELVREVRATGYVEAVSTVSVGAEISGRVATVEVDFNQHVAAGQVLARFDITALEAQQVQSAALALAAKAQVAQARADLEQARRTKVRADQLFAQQAQAVNEHESAVTALAGAVARVSAAEASFAAQTALATVARTNVDHAVIRSPIDGVIITRNIDPGQTVASIMTTPVLFTVAADLRKMQVLASIDEADVAGVAVGQGAQFTVTAWLGRSFSGTVTEVRNAARVVQDVVTYGSLIQVDNLDLALKPGMTASVRVRTGFEPDALQVPNTALRFSPPGQPTSPEARVWVLEGGALVAKPVHPGLSDGEHTALASADLPLGTLVLVDFTPQGKVAYGVGAR